MPPWQSRPAPPLRAAIVVSVWLSHAVLIPIYWDRAWIVHLPLPISPYVNASAPPFGGSGLRPTPRGESLEQFLAKLSDWWRQDAARTSRERRVQPPRTWRTRPDPFEGVWCDVLSWLQEDPDASAVVLLGRLQEAEPDRFSRAHLRTLQRRVQQWRGIMAKKLVYATGGEPMAELPAMPELALVGVDPRC